MDWTSGIGSYLANYSLYLSTAQEREKNSQLVTLCSFERDIGRGSMKWRGELLKREICSNELFFLSRNDLKGQTIYNKQL